MTDTGVDTGVAEQAPETGTWPPGYWQVVGPPYALVLEEAPDHLVPSSARRRLHVDFDQRPHRSDSCTLEGAGGPPGVARLTWPVHHDPWTAWVRHRGHGAWLPYLLDRESIIALESIAPGEPVARRLGRLRHWQLHAAGVLATPDRGAAEIASWDRSAECAREEFGRCGFTNVGALVEPLHLGRLRRYYRTLVRHSGTNGVHLGDKQTTGRHVAYNEPVARFFQHQLVGAVSQIVGHPVKPSFCYSASYVQGPGLPLHTDRVQCQYTLSVLIDMWPEPLSTAKWPLVLATSSGHVPVYQALGDGLLFLGRDIPHGRPEMRRKQFSTSLLFHYVDPDFDEPLG